MRFEPVIGLEVHAQLRTETKIFCGCGTAFGAPPNSQVCPVCLGLPGALPVLNQRAVEHAVRTAAALECRVREVSLFARKNYFYPDLPKGYQISQYEEPLATDGRVEYLAGGEVRRVRILRVHMEEDAGKSIHDGFPDSGRNTYLDFNRSGVPLVEIVTHPDLRAPAEAARFFQCLRGILLAAGVNDGNMEEGSLRCDANVSVRPRGAAALGVKVEIKNLNSFRFLERALDHEVRRQSALLERGGTVAQETRLWDVAGGRTVSMRGKEEAHDYRYFPDPDLPPLVLDPEWVAGVRAGMPELPEARKRRFMAEYGLPERDAEPLAGDRELAAFFERTLNVRDAARKISTFLPELDGPLAGASGLFRHRLKERLRWAQAEPLSEQQRQLAHLYLGRGDFVRAAMFGWEACVNRLCEEEGVSTLAFSEERQRVLVRFKEEVEGPRRRGFESLNALRNALAHGTRPGWRRIQAALRTPNELSSELQSAMRRFFE